MEESELLKHSHCNVLQAPGAHLFD
uniref:Structural maintenance of chromosomes 6 smc6 n=1 Tax=Rhizophora mucronata TaxID=61149 RepID=A0A2P2KQD5_RHIMU